MPHVGLPEMLVILVIILVIFGAGRLPEIGNALGKGIREFRATQDGDSGGGRGQEEAPKSG